MNNRWQMNRMGFVNFWLYDNEIFDFENGKILIRGTNGSGKSITTQSIVSFILDGNRSPERLDSFGSNDRKMEYYFLGDNSEITERTGYIFLELKKRGIEQYKTIGVGQKAQKGKPMSFWGFVLSDGRRIGIDFELYENIGEKRQVYDKNKLIRALGEKNRLVERQKDYMEMINKEFFGFSDINHYQKLIKFLLKIRASKLSTDIKPSNVHEILNDSLQILDEEDLRILAESLEKMDNMQEMNEKQKAARNDLKKLKKEYDEYNKIVLTRKAEYYSEAVKEYENLNNKVKNVKKEIEKLEKESTESSDLKDKIEKRLEIIEQENKVLRNIDLERNVTDLRNAETELKIKEKEISDTKNDLEDHKDNLKRKDVKKRDEIRNQANIKSEISEYYQEMSEINDTLFFDGHLKNENELFERNIYIKLREIKDNIEIYRENLHSALEILRKDKILSEKTDKAEEDYSHSLAEKEKAEEEKLNAEILEDRARDNLIEKFYILKEENHFLKISKSELEKIVELIKEYEGLSQEEEIKKILEKNYKLKNQELYNQKMELDFKKKTVEEELKRESEELEKLRNRKESTPERTKEREQCREELRKEGIPFISFYEAVDFSQDLSDEEKNILESQLKESGILDSLLIPYSFRERSEKIIEKYSDIILDFQKNDENLEESKNFDKLRLFVK